MQSLIREKIAVIAAFVGVLELLGALGCLITTLLFGNVTNTDLQAGQLYAKYYDSSSPTRRYGTNGGTYWWIGLPFLLPGMVGIATVATRNVKVMVVFMITNILSFFSAIGLAIFVGLFYNLWKVPMKAYAANNCVFEYHQATSRTFCQCVIADRSDVQLMDADRMWIYVQACDEVEIINMMLIIIITLSIITACLALMCSFIACYGIKTAERPKSQQKTGFHPLPATFQLTEQPPEKQPLAEKLAEPAFQPRDDFNSQQKPRREEYASQYPPPYQAATKEKEPLSSGDEKEDIDAGWL